MKLDLTNIKKASKVLLAVSAKKTFPNTFLVGGATTALGFYFDFVFPFEFQSSFLVLIEENINRLIKSDLPFKVMDMVPFSASEMLRYQGEEYRSSDMASSEEPLVQIVEVDGIIDVLDEELFSKFTSEAGAVKLKSFEKIGKKGKKEVIRIWGAASTDKQALKKFLKEELEIVQKLHTEIVKNLQVCSFLPDLSSYAWLQNGQVLLNNLALFAQKNLLSQGFSQISLPSSTLISYQEEVDEEPLHAKNLMERARLVQSLGLNKCFEFATFHDFALTDFSCGLLKTIETRLDLGYNFCSEKQVYDECISSLIFIGKMLKILGFEFDVVLSSRRVKPSALSNKERMLIETLKKCVSSLEEVDLIETTHSTFQGVKVEFKIADILGRKWSTAFLQVYCSEGVEGATIISSLLGPRERMVALLLEKHESVPFILLDRQVRVVVSSEDVRDYAESVVKQIDSEGFRSDIQTKVFLQNKNFCKRLLEKNQIVLILGEEEKKSSTIKLRELREIKDQTLTLDKLILRLKSY